MMKKPLTLVVSLLVLLVIGSVFYQILTGKNDPANVVAIQEDVASGIYDYNLGTKALDKQDYAAAELHFKQVLEGDRSKIKEEIYINTLVNLGLCYAQQEKLDQAEQYWTMAAKMGDEQAAANLEMLKEGTPK